MKRYNMPQCERNGAAPAQRGLSIVRGRIPRLALCAALIVASGCASRTASLTKALPKAQVAMPYILVGDAWHGSFEEAQPALGPDADAWRPYDPTHVWLAVYDHYDDPDQSMTVRVFAFASSDAAHRAYEGHKPHDTSRFDAGDAGCWTEVGVLFVWGRLVFDVFGSHANSRMQFQAARFTGYIERNMPAGLPEDPR